ncbi:hypothetical protein ABT008_12570 [Micromonospora sp. NPDC002389]|uniref:hypothetical protein n=1 Tax=Micromonospora sp. NPDC002389 TaxID=3154272 RepID=UPI0033222C1D
MIDQMHASLDSRLRPEDIAALILDSGQNFTTDQRHLLLRAKNSRGPWWVSSMSSDFTRPVDATRQLATLTRLFGHDPQAIAGAVADPDALRMLAVDAGQPIDWAPGRDFRSRLNREGRSLAGIDLSKRQYNRAWRFLTRLDAKVTRLDAELRKRELMLTGRSGLAADITADRFAADPAAASFVAYVVARKNLRRQFSLSGKTNPMDEIAAMLLARLPDDADWWMVSRVHSVPEVVQRLTPVQQGELIGRWSTLMRAAADILAGAWDPQVDRTLMIVRRGMDSSTWNTVAQAYNTARAGWLNALAATGTLDLLDVACPGKVMRLMAADLAQWHRSTGSGVDPDTAVFAALPLPWEVLSGTTSCTRDDVARMCSRFEVDAVKRGWVGPRAVGQVTRFEPTPELVHGVTIADPVWAGLLRQAGAFSGKKVRTDHENVVVPVDVIASDRPSGPKPQ